jgi:hypothetical protein
MSLPKRFRLSALLLAMLGVALLMGYAQWRRHELESELRSLSNEGAYATDFRPGWMWPTAGERAHVFVPSVVRSATTDGESEAKLEVIQERLRAVGISKIFLDQREEPGAAR